MNLTDSASRQHNMWRDCGYAMAALLIAMSVMAILLTVALPTWRQTIQREKEEEMIFRGGQYSRAIAAYQRKYANASPPTFDALVEQHYLRKKFKDPMAVTEDGEFQPLYAALGGAEGGAGGSPTPSGRGIIGVASRNTAESIREYNGHTHYNEWQFIPVQQSTRAGGGGQNTGTGGQNTGGGRQGNQTQTPSNGGQTGNPSGNTQGR